MTTRRGGVLPPNPDQTSLIPPGLLSKDVSALPPSVDLRSTLTGIRDQGSSFKCVAYALCAVKEQQDSTGGYLSTDFIYDRRSNRPGDGMIMVDALKIVQSFGVCAESKRGGGEELSNAAIHKISGWHDVRNLLALKSAIAARKVCIISLPLYPASDEKTFWVKYGQQDGLHAVCIVGYNDSNSTLILRNSWGKSWGDNGYGYISYADYQSKVAEAYSTDDNDNAPNPEAPAKKSECCVIA